MATFVVHNRTGATYALMGAGYGLFHSKSGNAFFGDWLPDVSEGRHPMLCVCDRHGEIGWIASSEVTVESIDGQEVRAAFKERG